MQALPLSKEVPVYLRIRELIYTHISLKWKRRRLQLFPLPTGSEFTLPVAPRDFRVPCVRVRWRAVSI